VTRLTVCICTRNRPGELERCLASIAGGDELPAAVIVSDDGSDPGTREVVEAASLPVVYTKGPGSGLAANRNHCLAHVRTPLVAFVDDDALVSPGFVLAAVNAAGNSPGQIVTGWEMNFGEGARNRVTPHNADFWGLQRADPRGQLRAIVVNATVFPTNLFSKMLFDERLKYGSEEVDIAQRAVASGTNIRFDNALWVEHRPAVSSREEYASAAVASRIYQNIKRHAVYERSWTKALLFAVLGPTQVIVHSAKHKGVREAAANLCGCFRGIWWAVPILRRSVRNGLL
jgi:glycosyltransferase involved in cell wall biosynthesis